MFRRYSGNGKSTPLVLTVPASVPVDGSTSGAGPSGGAVRGAGSRSTSGSGGGGGGASSETEVRWGRGCCATGGGCCACLWTVSGARRCWGSGLGAAMSSTEYTGTSTSRTRGGEENSKTTADTCTTTVAAAATLLGPPSGVRRHRRRARLTAGDTRLLRRVPHSECLQHG